MKKIKLYDYQQDMLRKIIDALTVEKPRGMFFDKWGRKDKRGNSVLVQMPRDGRASSLPSTSCMPRSSPDIMRRWD